VTVLQEDSHAVQYPKSFLVLDNADIDAMLAVIYEERGLTLRHMTYAAARDMIEIRKIFKDPEYYEHMVAIRLTDCGRNISTQRRRTTSYSGATYISRKSASDSIITTSSN
jgi:hypothetical protein